MNNNPINDGSIYSCLTKLKKRKPNTKYQLVNVLVELGDNWHILDEIRTSAEGKEIATSHLFENLLELSRLSFIETDFKKKRTPKLSSFKISSLAYPELQKMLSQDQA
jgi:hypothetical protein